jgi:AraC-like DNA-binding protein
MVEVALFNITDISLLFSGFLALVLSFLLFFSRQQGRIKKIYWQFLALFFFLGALRTFDTLVYWSVNVRDTLSLVTVNFFFLFQLYQYKRHLQANHSVLNKADMQWLKLLKPASAADAPPPEPQQQLAEKLTDFMEQKKPYLEPHITVERLAIKLNVSPKLLSCTINNKLNMNFFELIGTYRVAEAKKRLADSEFRQKPIGEIMKSCGFNSKSVFNQAFKKTVGVTPSHYRQQHLH